MAKTSTTFKPGQPRPENAGRKPGTPNKRTQAMVEVLEKLKLNPLDALNNLLPNLEPEKQADVYLKLLEYLYPKRKAVEHSGPEGAPIQFAPAATNEDRAAIVRAIRESESA